LQRYVAHAALCCQAFLGEYWRFMSETLPPMARKTLTPRERSYLEEIGDRIRTSREAKDWTQDQLVEKAKRQGIGMSRRTLGAIEKGIHNVSAVSLIGIFHALRMDRAELERVDQLAAEEEEAILSIVRNLTPGQRAATISMMKEFFRSASRPDPVKVIDVAIRDGTDESKASGE
jgi:transcriptional regulator with XRE-family HTH domain